MSASGVSAVKPSEPDDPCTALLAPPAHVFVEQWNALVDHAVVQNPKKAEDQAILRFLQNAHGSILIGALTRMFKQIGVPVRIRLTFVPLRKRGEAGSYSPAQSVPPTDPEVYEPMKSWNYDVTVGLQDDHPDSPETPWPGLAPETLFTYHSTDGASEMAFVIFHELQHIKYQNDERVPQPQNAITVFPEGHAAGHGSDLTKISNYDDSFSFGLQSFALEMDRLEDCIHRPAPNKSPTGSPPKAHP